MRQFEKSVPAGVTPTETGGFRGYAARFLNIDRQRDLILPGAFTKALPEFIDAGGLVLADHKNTTSSVIGTLIDAQEDRNGLMVDVMFSATKSGQEMRQLMTEKAVHKMSIKFDGYAKPYTETQIKELWATYGFVPSERQKALAKRGCNVITKAEEIYEVSVVPIPANPEASILAVKSFDEPVIETPSPVDLLAIVERAQLADRLLGRLKR